MTGRTFQPHIITDDSASGGQIIDGSLKFNIARNNYLKRYPSVDGAPISPDDLAKLKGDIPPGDPPKNGKPKQVGNGEEE